MKKHLLLLSLFSILLPLSLIAQSASKVVPINVYWIADGKRYDINQAQSGIHLPDKLEIAIVLPANQKLENQRFEFKWYLRGATRDYLTNSFIKKVERLNSGETQIILKSGRTNLRKGWWKVRIDAYIDRKSLGFQNKQVFWIKLL